jgi:hypothetical protein
MEGKRCRYNNPGLVQASLFLARFELAKNMPIKKIGTHN